MYNRRQAGVICPEQKSLYMSEGGAESAEQLRPCWVSRRWRSRRFFFGRERPWSSAAFPRQWTAKLVLVQPSCPTRLYRMRQAVRIQPDRAACGSERKDWLVLACRLRVAIAAFAQKLQEGSRGTFWLDNRRCPTSTYSTDADSLDHPSEQPGFARRGKPRTFGHGSTSTSLQERDVA